MYREITKCRVCGNDELNAVLDLGTQYLTGIFPSKKNDTVTKAPLELVKCAEDGSGEACGLLQLKHSVDPSFMYGDNYGYRSGINKTMRRHLQEIVDNILKMVDLKKDDIVLDIGSNDGTLLKAYPDKGLSLVGMDPSSGKLREYYTDRIKLVVDYFSPSAFRSIYGQKKAQVVTSIAMFYDLESPIDFMRDIESILADDGIWVFEQSYMPLMLKRNAYDTVCHEHLEYYGLRQIAWMAKATGLKVIDVSLNDINGGSFAVTVAKERSEYKPRNEHIEPILRNELEEGLDTLRQYAAFKERVYKHRDDLVKFIKEAKEKDELVVGYGASTKGNVVLQFCGLGSLDIPAIADRNPAKFGRFTPGTGISIVSEEEARSRRPKYFLVFPWHFKDEFIKREGDFLDSGGKFLFPLPEIESVGR